MRRVNPLTFAFAMLAGCAANQFSNSTPDLAEAPPPDLAPPSLTWQHSGAVSPSRDHHGTFATASFVYVVGGTDHFTSAAYDDVQRAPIEPDGSLGAFQKVSTLPNKLASMGVAVVGDEVVLTGGITQKPAGFGYTAETLSAKIAADGTLSAWTQGPPIPGAREHMSLLADGRTLYLVGGLVGRDGTTDVERAMVAADGTIGAWSKLTSLPGKRSHHAAVVTAGAIYVLGGLQGDPTNGATSFNDVLRAPIAADGTLGDWTQVSTLPNALSTHSAQVFGGAIFLLGGIEDDAVFVDHVRRAALLPDGTLTAWQDMTPLPSARGHVLETPLVGSAIYSVGGYTNDSVTIADVVVGRYQ